jgi:hypothetical protein
MKLLSTSLVATFGLFTTLAAHAEHDEMHDVLSRLLSVKVQAAAGFKTRMLVPPGELYDPLVMHPMGEQVWLNDDGKEEQGADGEQKGSRLMAVDHTGKVSVLVDADKMLPISAGFDVAPAGFGGFGGQVFALSQPKTGDKGGQDNYVMQRIDPKAGFAVSVFCTLPASNAKETAGIGVDARFGPPGSPFFGKLFASTTLNNTIYQITPDGRCEPFVRLDPAKHGGPLYLRFTPDGQQLLVTVVRGGIFAASGSAILAIRADGTVEDKALAEAPTMFGSIDFAPAGFGTYGGQIFVVEVGSYEIPVPAGRPLAADGKLHRVTPEGKLELVASGLINPWNVRFVGNRLWVGDINGDFIYGRRELPDGFIVEVTPQ